MFLRRHPAAQKVEPNERHGYHLSDDIPWLAQYGRLLWSAQVNEIGHFFQSTIKTFKLNKKKKGKILSTVETWFFDTCFQKALFLTQTKICKRTHLDATNILILEKWSGLVRYFLDFLRDDSPVIPCSTVKRINFMISRTRWVLDRLIFIPVAPKNPSSHQILE